MKKKLYLGNCLDILQTIPANKIDTCITDPPYELGFMGKSWDNAGVSFQKETWKAVYRVLKPGAFLLAFGGTRTWHRIGVAIEDAGFEIRDTICWLYGQGFPKSYNIGKGIDKKAGKEREYIGEGKYSSRKPHHYEGGNSLMISKNDPRLGHPITAPATPEAELWEGWGTALKPAFEPIIVAMKPIDETYVNNALTHGVAGMWIDGGRITTKDKLIAGGNLVTNSGDEREGKALGMLKDGTPNTFVQNDNGRFPANVILDEVSAEMLDKQTGISKGGFVRNRTDGARPFENEGKDTGYETVAEISEPDGGASRFFYCAKANKSERNLGIDNKHPTVKPLSLIKYLTRLTRTPTSGIVLDPFMGSGTTGMACVLEDRYFIGIEMNEEYYEIAKLRIKYAMENRDELLTKYK